MVIAVVAIVSWGVGTALVASGSAAFTSTTAGVTSLSATGMAVTGGAAGAVGGGLSAGLSGGDLEAILKGAVVGGIQGAIAGGVLHGWSPDVAGFNFETARHVAGHGVLGGSANYAMGGKFQDGFFSAAAGVIGSYSSFANGGIVSRTVKAGVIGGTVAEIGGGKFANGAYTAAFQHLLNYELDAAVRARVSLAEDGDGEIWERTYTLEMEGSTKSPEDLISSFSSTPNRFTSTRNPFIRIEFGAALSEGLFVTINGFGPVNPSVYVCKVRSTSLTLITAIGHPESGAIRFISWQSGSTTVFRIHSRASTVGFAYRAIYNHGNVGKSTQTHVWTNVLKNVDVNSNASSGSINFTAKRSK